jgi:glycopeptide antibiotics resistance protein
VLVPFANAGWEFATFYGLLRDVALFVPVGMLAATWKTPPDRPVRRMGMSTLLGALVVLAIEISQLLVYKGVTATDHLICGTLGVCLGAWIVRRWHGGSQPCSSAPPLKSAARWAWLWLGLAAVYAVSLAVVYCAPFEVIDDLPRIRQRYHDFLRPPFAGYYRATQLQLASDFLKVLLFAPLGGLLALAVARLRVPRPIRRILLGIVLLAAAGVAGSIEMAQVFLPPHVPSGTHVVLGSVGAAIGMLAALLLHAQETK